MQADCREFICSIVCQDVIQLKWCGGIQANVIVLILAYICPLLLCSPLVSFSVSSSLPDHTTEEEVFQLIQQANKQLGTNMTARESEISVRKKLDMFYNAPKTKFCIHNVNFS